MCTCQCVLSTNIIQIEIDASLFRKATEAINPMLTKKFYMQLSIAPARIMRLWWVLSFIKVLRYRVSHVVQVLHVVRWKPFCGPPVTVCLLTHGIFLLSFLRRTHLLFGICSYDWVHCLILLSLLNSSFIELWPCAVLLLLLLDGIILRYSFMLTVRTLIHGQPRLLSDSLVSDMCSLLLIWFSLVLWSSTLTRPIV